MIDDERDRAGDLDATSEKEFRGGSAGKEGGGRRSASLPPMNEDANLGTALRNAYQKTVDEEIPAEMLDLLNRLS